MARTKKGAVKSPPPNKRGEASTSRQPRLKRKASRRLQLEDEPSSGEDTQQQEEQDAQGDQEEEVPYDKSRFTSAENEAWYNARRGAKVLVEKDVTSDAEEVYHLKASFAKLGWENFFNIPNFYYEELVREFYANVEDKKVFHYDTEVITSTVRGRKVRVHRADLERYLHVSDVGRKVDLKKAFKPNDLDSWNMLEALVRLGVEYKATRTTGRYSVLTSSFPESQRLLIYLFAANIIPRASGTNEARTSDIYFLDKMKHGLGNIQGIPLGSIITNHMWAVVRSNDIKHAFPYPRFLTFEFQRVGVDFSNAFPTGLKKKDVFTLDFCRFILKSKDGGGPSTQGGAQGDIRQEEEVEIERIEGAQGVETTTPPVSNEPSSSRPPTSPQDTRSFFKKIMDKLLCVEAEVKKSRQENKRNSERIRRIETKLGIEAPPTPPSSPDQATT
ncbi:uncharacterized protein LOC113771382 [Coffea eugenioides]|uniref:uncharacterized protein LOC113771381 n=1 Tax=Coffea eugenioides TaxID=49369 RepID=UPI000F60744A|nr:uncharacterized protein LOC113771381 [Coffea eugenioides]XP_027171770.1 uncharacterized protein LOC113771382 [Coffea eugenioides]